MFCKCTIKFALRQSLAIHQPNMHVVIVLPFINHHSMTLASLSQGIDPNSLDCNINVAGCSDKEWGRLFTFELTTNMIASGSWRWWSSVLFIYAAWTLNNICGTLFILKLASAMQRCNKVLYFWIIRTCDVITFNIYAWYYILLVNASHTRSRA